ncbi:MAG: cryptochrome/photolyase CryB [Kiloniellaceae bacterium]
MWSGALDVPGRGPSFPVGSLTPAAESLSLTKSKRSSDAAPHLALVLGDQLSEDIAALRQADKGRDVVLLAEVAEEAGYVRHHKKKIAFLFAAMRHFAAALEKKGWQVDYVRLDARGNSGSLPGEIQRAVKRHKASQVLVTEPGEWRLLQAFKDLREELDVPLDILEDDRFLCPLDDFAKWAEGRKQLRMEYFYREMRRKTELLMDGDDPEGGRWNYDSENRKPPKEGLDAPGPKRFKPDKTTREVLELVDTRFDGHFGALEPFWFAVTPRQAEAAAEHFFANALPCFGDYQDAMLRDEAFLYHSVIALYLNAGLLDALDLCRRAERAYRDGEAPLNAVEGFIRQIIGWREYVRGIYWLKMPDYAEANFFGHDRPLPEFYWSGESDMACLAACVGQTRDEAYAHHIQRLMVTGNFALLAGIEPQAVHRWYLSVYADAYEWVELPNTLGMALFADGGLLGSKPYAASGNYINKMSDYCKDCAYDVKQKTGEAACPFNYLYWDFLDRHARKLGKNPRLAQIYRTWEKMDDARKKAVRQDAKRFLKSLTPADPKWTG